MRLEKENSDTVKVHFAKIIEKQKNPGHLKINYFETLRKVPVNNSLNDILKKNNKILNVHGISADLSISTCNKFYYYYYYITD